MTRQSEKPKKGKGARATEPPPLSSPTVENVEFSETRTGNPLVINRENGSLVLSYYVEEVTSDRAFRRIIEAVEKMIRASKEYKTYISYLWNRLDLTTCSYLGNVDGKRGDAAVEFHHFPLTLYDVVEMVVVRKLVRREKFSTFLIAAEVLDLHIRNMVGLVPLTTTLHELTHAGKLRIGLSRIFGNYQILLEEYAPGTTPRVRKKMDEIRRLEAERGPESDAIEAEELLRVSGVVH